MKLYYIGNLIQSTNTSEPLEFNLNFHKPDIHNAKNQIIDKRFELSDFDLEYLKKNLKIWDNKKNGIQDEKLISILEKIIFFRLKPYNTISIIYEIVENKNGIKYAKELITGLLFPMENFVETKKYYYSIDDDKITKTVTYKDPNIARFKYIVTNDDVACVNEIEKYTSVKQNKTSLRNFQDQIMDRYNENVFNAEIEIKEIKTLEKQNEITKLMEDIEYILNLIKQINYELYIKYSSEYESYCFNNINNINIYISNKQNFINLLSKIKLSLLINEYKYNNIIDYLNAIIEKYFNKVFNNEINDKEIINLIDIDNLMDMFLKDKDNYNILEQREVIKKISLLYLFVIKANISNINENTLENSYFKDNIKSIILNINGLLETETIKNNFTLDFSKVYSISDVLNIIYNMEFNELNKDHIKKLIK